ncbi:MAG: hypothetical protein KDB07_10120 [Planctomycetes bacterium]|nr:hypothetical protein [Planctomycetota bacterium]
MDQLPSDFKALLPHIAQRVADRCHMHVAIGKVVEGRPHTSVELLFRQPFRFGRWFSPRYYPLAHYHGVAYGQDHEWKRIFGHRAEFLMHWNVYDDGADLMSFELSMRNHLLRVLLWLGVMAVSLWWVFDVQFGNIRRLTFLGVFFGVCLFFFGLYKFVRLNQMPQRIREGIVGAAKEAEAITNWRQ